MQGSEEIRTLIISDQPPGVAPYDSSEVLISPNDNTRAFTELPLCTTESGGKMTTEWYVEHGITIAWGDVLRADLSKKTLVVRSADTNDGRSMTVTYIYENLVLATGLEQDPMFSPEIIPGPGWRVDTAPSGGSSLAVCNEVAYGFGSVHYVSDGLGDFVKLSFALSRAEDDDQETCFDPVCVSITSVITFSTAIITVTARSVEIMINAGSGFGPHRPSGCLRTPPTLPRYFHSPGAPWIWASTFRFSSRRGA